MIRPSSRTECSGLVRLTASLGFTQLVPLLTSIMLALIVARLGSRWFSSYMLVASINITTTVAAGALFQALFIVGGRALGCERPSDYDAARRATWWIAVVASVAVTVISVLIGPALAALHIDPVLAGTAGDLGRIVAIGLPPALCTMVLRIHAALFGFMLRATVIYAVGGLSTIAFAMLGSQYGGLNMVGAGIVFGNWFQFGLALLLLQSPLTDTSHMRGEILPPLRALWHLGWPVALVVFMDSFASSASTLVVARFWPSYVPQHSTMLLAITIGLILPLGLGMAALQRVTIADASNGPTQAAMVARRAMAIALCYGILVVVAASIVGFGLSIPLLFPAGLLLALQSVIVVAAAVLRTAGLIRAPLIYGAIGYLLLGVGGAWALGVEAGYGIYGVWTGLISGFGFTACAVLNRAFAHFPQLSPIAASGPLVTAQYQEGTLK